MAVIRPSITLALAILLLKLGCVNTTICPVQSSMISGWPDALYCTDASNNVWVYNLTEIKASDPTNIQTIYQIIEGGTTSFVKFNADRSSLSNSGGEIVNNCRNKSIDEIIEDGNAKFYYPTTEAIYLHSLWGHKPDVIRCSTGHLYYLRQSDTTEIMYETFIYPTPSYGNRDYARFNFSTGELIEVWPGMPTSNTGACFVGKTLQDLYDECLAYNIVSKIPNSITGENTNSAMNPNWPNAINCHVDDAQKIIFWAKSLYQSDRSIIYFDPLSNYPANTINPQYGFIWDEFGAFTSATVTAESHH